MAKKSIRTYRASDGTDWEIRARLPSHSGAQILFVYRGNGTPVADRYAWVHAIGSGVHDPRSRISLKDVIRNLTEEDLGRLYERSMPVHADRPGYIVS